MEINFMKQKLHWLVDNGDDKILNMLYALANVYCNEEDFIFTDADIEEFEKRSTDRVCGKSKTYSWQEAKQMIVAR